MVWLGVYLLMSWIQNHFYFFYLLYISLIDVVVFKNTYELDVFYSFTSVYSISYVLKYNTRVTYVQCVIYQLVFECVFY